MFDRLVIQYPNSAKSIYKSEGWAFCATHDWPGTSAHHIGVVSHPYWLASAPGTGGEPKAATRPLYDDNREPRGSLPPCARPGPQVPDAMPINIARQVREGKFASQKFASGC